MTMICLQRLEEIEKRLGIVGMISSIFWEGLVPFFVYFLYVCWYEIDM